MRAKPLPRASFCLRVPSRVGSALSNPPSLHRQAIVESSPLNSASTNGVSHSDPQEDFLSVIRLSLLVLFGVLSLAPTPASNVAKGASRRVNLGGPSNMGPRSGNVVQVFDAKGDPRYFMDVSLPVFADTKETVTVRLHFDPLGNYERYELPSGGRLTKRGRIPFSPDDHKKLHEILSDPNSPLKSVNWDQITMPKSSGAAGDKVDGISGATVLTKRGGVIVGAAYTCYTLWHWSHGEVVNVIREMTASASDKQDLIRYLHSGQYPYVAFAADQLQTRKLFDAATIDAAVHVMRHGSAELLGPVLSYLAKAAKETGTDCFLRCRDDAYLVVDSNKRVQFLEALRDFTRELPSDYLERFSGWLARADSYYEVHLLLTLLERGKVSSAEIVSAAMSLLESKDPLIVRRSYRYLKAQKLSQSQQQKLEKFEQEHPDR